jgi:Domain of unknown function (DUF1992)
MNPLDRLAEARIEEALREGAFEGVPGAGQPLRLDDLTGVPDDVRGGYLLLKGAGCLPPEMELKRETLRLQDLLDACQDEGGRAELRRRRGAALLRFELLMERRGGRAALGDYAGPIAERLGRSPDGP